MGEFIDGYFYGFVYFKGIGVGLIGFFRKIEGLVTECAYIVNFDLDNMVLKGSSVFDIVDYLYVDLQIIFE